jgi:LacI family transcriptional regulator
MFLQLWSKMTGRMEPKTAVVRVNLQDVARAAGVSAATVDRVLNNRSGVRSRTRDVVLDVARRLGYIADPALPAINPVAPPRTVKLAFLLPSGTNSFINLLHDQIERQAAERPELQVRVERVEGFNPAWVANRLRELRGTVSGVGIVAQDHPLVREAIRDLDAAGMSVVTIASDVQNVPRLAYVGIDNRQAGRLAGYLIGRVLVPRKAAKVALFAGSLSYRGHEEREMGFRHILRDEFPDIQVVNLRETQDDRARAHNETLALLHDHPEIAAIYNLGGATQGIAQALTARGQDGRIVLIAHDLTQANKASLLDGTLEAIIDQNPRVEAREALNILTNAALGNAYSFVAPRIQLIFRENIPFD